MGSPNPQDKVTGHSQYNAVQQYLIKSINTHFYTLQIYLINTISSRNCGIETLVVLYMVGYEALTGFQGATVKIGEARVS